MLADNIKFKPLGAILLAGGIMLCALTYLKERSGGLLFSETICAQAVVTERFTVMRNAKPVLKLLVQVPVNGQKHVIERTVDESFWQQVHEGSQVQVVFPAKDKNLPKNKLLARAKIEGATMASTFVWLKLVGGGGLSLLGIALLAYDRWQR